MYVLAAIYPTKKPQTKCVLKFTPCSFQQHFVRMEKTLCNVSGHKLSPLNAISNPTPVDVVGWWRDPRFLSIPQGPERPLCIHPCSALTGRFPPPSQTFLLQLKFNQFFVLQPFVD